MFTVSLFNRNLPIYNGSDEVPVDQTRTRALKTQLAHIEHRINAVAAISRVPPEILSEIFVCYADVLKDRERIAVAHVCQFWREVALNTSKLWAKIDLLHRPTEAVRTYLARSKHAPLKIIADYGDPPITSLRLAAQHWSRAESIRLSLTPLAYAAIVTCLPSSTPLLKALQVGIQLVPDWKLAPPVPIPFNQSTAPLLQSLEISSCCVEWATHIFPRSLTRLTVTYNAGAAEISDASILDVVRTISNLSLLQYLELRNVLPSPPSSTIPLPIEILATMSQLQEMDITASALSYAHFLNHFTLPTSTKLRLQLTDGPIDALPLLTASLRSKLLHMKPEPDSLYIDDRVLQLFSCTNELLLHVIAQDLDFAYGTLVEEVYARLPLHGILCLTVSGEPCHLFGQTAWTEMVKAMVNVLNLHVCCDGMRLSSNSLNLLTLAPGVQEPVMPNLKHIALDSTVFRNRDDESDLSTINQLCAIFKSRSEAGFGFETVSIEEAPEGSHINAGDIALFEQYVSKVVWDGWDLYL